MHKSDDARYALYGRACLIPGIQRSIECLQEMLDEIRNQLAGVEEVKPKRVYVRKKKAKKGGGWSEDPEERKAEMARRLAKRAPDKRQPPASTGNHPSHRDHPGHDAWVKKTLKARMKARALRLENAA